MAQVSFKINGIDAFKAKIDQAISNCPKEAAAALYQFGNEVMTESLRRVPVKTGTLMSTGHVTLPETNGSHIEVTLGYGGPAAPYALAVHENMSPTVNWTRPGSGPKYLEAPLVEKQDELPGKIAEAVRNSIK